MTVETYQRPPRRVSMPRALEFRRDLPQAGRAGGSDVRNDRHEALRMPVALATKAALSA